MGAKEGMSHLCFAILGPGDVTIAPDPCYPIHAGAPRIAGSEVEFYSARAGIAPAQAVSEAIARFEARGQKPKLVIANYPQNPTGRVISRDEMTELVRVVQRSGWAEADARQVIAQQASRRSRRAIADAVLVNHEALDLGTLDAHVGRLWQHWWPDADPTSLKQQSL